MSASVNKAVIIGRLGKDPEVRFTSGGKSVASFSVATDESYKGNDGEKVKKTEWHNIVAWGNAVENFIQPYLHKGDLVYIEGKMQTRSWDDKTTGTKRYTTEINVTDIKGLVTGNQDQERTETKAQGAKPKPAPASAPVDDEDIPF